MHIVLVRHCTRIDKSKHGISPGQSEISLKGIKNNNIQTNDQNGMAKEGNIQQTAEEDEDEEEEEPFKWLSNFDPPLNERIAAKEMDSAFKKISNNVASKKQPRKIMLHSSPYNRCIQTTELLLDRILHSKQFDNKPNIKLRVDQALSEWLNENYNLKYLPPNDDGYSMINNVNAYLNQMNFNSETNVINNKKNYGFNQQTRQQLKNVKDATWSYNKLGHCGDYGESASSFTSRCFKYLINLLQFYYGKQDSTEDRQMVVVIISHGAVISTLLQILLGRSVFNEIPLCTPIYFKQSERRRSVFKLRDYDFNLSNLLSPSSDKEFYKILDSPIDLTKLDPDNLRSELTIGTTGYTTIIQSIPKKIESPKLTNSSTRRRRRNTINIGEKEKDHNEDNGIETLKQTRSSRQLYLLNKDTSEEKVIDLDKLHSYFGGDGSESESESDHENFDDNKGTESLKKNVFKGSITSLSSFNEENKSKFQLNMKNFFSKPSPIKSDPFSHFYLTTSSSYDTELSDYDEFNMSRRGSEDNGENNEMSKKIGFNIDYDSSEEENDMTDKKSNTSEEGEDEEEEEDDHILSFGTRNKVYEITKKLQQEVNSSNNLKTNSSTIFDGTFSKGPIRSSNELEGLNNKSGSKLDSVINGLGINKLNSNDTINIANTNANSGSNIKLVIPKLISTRNMNMKVRGGSEGEEIIEENNNSKKSCNNLLKKMVATSPNGYGLSGDASDSESESGSDSEGGWFGGFSR